MKYISFAIPCYNSEAYMEKAINSILIGGEDVEILIVNDGSKDGTWQQIETAAEKRRKSPNGTKLNIRRSSRRSKKKTEDTAMQSTADFLMPQENILK